MKSDKNKIIQIRNSTAEFLIFTNQSQTSSIEVRYEDETFWLSQKLMASLFDVEVNTINYHLKEIYKSGEIQEEPTIRKFRTVQTEGKRQVNREILKNAGKISHAIAKSQAEIEFEKYRIIQDKLFQSDFDKLIDNIDNKQSDK
ncbi:MAG: phosphoribosylaminoimidazolesuccinocarboxamide synthase [Bacteroidota bacterium]|nr:phosphoribosylaminoimidazolesuccinocarboxamide synthase [Bacteroidota bacterium]